jgi:predicted nucleic acid-binding protein
MVGKSNEIFVDSNFLIALLNSEDSLREKASSKSRELAEQNTSYVISNLVFLEVVTVTSMRSGRTNAIEGGNKILANSRVRLVHIDETLHNETWDIFQNTEEKNISFVDCSIIATMRAENIQKLLTFDQKDFKQLQKNYRFSFYN